jgi:glycosyltransferase involved in cell wall biosynthesis
VDTTVYSGTKAGLRKPTVLDGLKIVPCFSTDAAFPLDNWTFNQTLARNANAIKTDVYEAHTASGYGLQSALQRRGVKVPFVQTIHGVLADEYVQGYLRGNLSPRAKLANLFMWQLAKHEEESAKNATLIVTISQYSKAKIRQFYSSVDRSKIRIVPNGVDSQRFTPWGQCKKVPQLKDRGSWRCVLFVGRLIPRKGLNYLIEAAKQVVKENKETLFVIVGDGPLRRSLVSAVEQANLAGNFAFLGDVDEQELPAVYRCADIFVLPSTQEGQGIALLEAQASAKPVVAFNVSGITEAVRNEETGLLVPPNIGELAQAILRLLSDSSLREKMGSNGREFVQNELSWDICAEKMLRVYREAMAAC